MRSHGLLADPIEVVGADHVCWLYDDDLEFAAVARAYLADGLSRGERLLCVGGAVCDHLRSGAAALPDADGLVERGALSFLDVSGAYARAGQLSVEDQLAYYDDATRQALDDVKQYTWDRRAARLDELFARVIEAAA